jgi:hypothetical protein
VKAQEMKNRDRQSDPNLEKKGGGGKMVFFLLPFSPLSLALECFEYSAWEVETA